MQRILWNLFNKTGNVNYYLLLSEIRGRNVSKNKRDNNKGNTI